MIDPGRVEELLQEASRLVHGPAQTGLLEEAVRLADLANDVRTGFRARIMLIDAAHNSGVPEKAIVALTWCLARVDQDPERFPEGAILASYSGVIVHLMSFPQFSKGQILAALADFTRRSLRSGTGMRAVSMLQFIVAGELGDLEEHHAAHERWENTFRGDFGDASDFDLRNEVTFLADNGRYEEAIARARPFLLGRADLAHCSAIAMILVPLVKLGRAGEAIALHRKSYPKMSRNRYFLYNVAQHVELLALTDNLARGVKLFEAHLPWALDTFDIIDRFRFSIASRFLFERLDLAGHESVKIRLPGSFPIHEPTGEYEVPGMLAWLESDSRDLGIRFDERNGNPYFARKIEQNRALAAFVSPHPLNPRSPGKSTSHPAD